ncbi:unnamed protein product [Colletotrichum noveboracense]|uniref:NAD(P)-binding protein n=1 Tax=Colletotrichum noveboracense TaxID=2664923 RepID=A0A9W4WH85_9PEZI|nr:unnamed protein product [Colletotrichum noveboracense]
MSFPYKQVLLVGATSGIGADMADKLVQEGIKVIAVGRRQDRLDAFVQKHGPSRADSICFDITDRAGLDNFVNEVCRKFPELDCVFINSGVQSQIRLSRPSSVDLDAFRNEVNTNFLSVVDISIKFLPKLQEKKFPTGLIFTGTHLAIIPAATLPAYSASKAAVHSYVYSLREQSRGSSTKIIEIWPPVVQSECKPRSEADLWECLSRSSPKKTYPQLVTGCNDVLVGSVGREEPYLELFRSRKQQADDLTKLVLSHFEL